MTADIDVAVSRTAGRTSGDVVLAAYVDELTEVAVRGLTQMFDGARQTYPHTVRRDVLTGGVRAEGENRRYAAMAALGLSCVDVPTQRQVLGGLTAAEFAAELSHRQFDAAHPGTVAVVAWAAGEADGGVSAPLLEWLVGSVVAPLSRPTVDLAWTITALLANCEVSGALDGARDGVRELLSAQGPHGIFPHVVPGRLQPRYRAHVGCFADQVYPIQALTRYYLHTGDERALHAANRCADRIVDLQGAAGQWWWHYDVRTGGVVEEYPVYSVHQHGMAPMALFELAEAGGHDHTDAVTSGLGWVAARPETEAPLTDADNRVIWRKVGRREPRKAVRLTRAVTTGTRSTFRVMWLDRAFPPGPVDFGCRPFELGWLLYAWRGDRRLSVARGVGDG